MKTIYIGKSAENDVVVQDAFVSRKHLRITLQSNGQYLLEDLGSTNGTFVNGKKVQKTLLLPNDIVRIGDTVLPWQNYFKPLSTPTFPTEKPLKTIRIGRKASNDFVITNPSVSQEHAILEIFANEQYVLTDLGSTNGTFVNGKKIKKSWLSATNQVQFGNEKIFVKEILQASASTPPQTTPKQESPTPPQEQVSYAPIKKQIEKPSAKKSIAFEGIALVILLLLAGYGATMYWKKNDTPPKETTLNKDNEKDYLTDYDDEGKLIEKNDTDHQKEEDKLTEEENTQKQEENNNNTETFEDIVERAENATFRVDALEGGFSKGFGTGFFVRSSGIGVSNYHVFAPGYSWEIKLKNGEKYEVINIIEENQELDYIIFQTSATQVPYLPIASQAPRKGQDIFVIGNPQGFEFSVTKGIVSGLRDYSSGYASDGDKHIQIDAPISSGNSGGPVLNMKGEVVGIATMVVNPQANNIVQNLNLAVNIQKLNIP
ncbi:MAG: hypothetical protein OHK0045_21440 [Raineya sp.]